MFIVSLTVKILFKIPRHKGEYILHRGSFIHKKDINVLHYFEKRLGNKPLSVLESWIRFNGAEKIIFLKDFINLNYQQYWLFCQMFSSMEKVNITF